MKTTDLVGTWTLLRLALRRDRIKLPLWVIGISAFVWIATGVNDQFSAEEMKAIVILAAQNPAMRMMVSPIMAESVTEVSRFVFFRFSFVFSILTVLMSIHAVTRHSRHNEQTGCAEMVGASVTGRYAGLASSVVVAVIANIVLAVLIGLGLTSHGLPAAGSFAAGASFGGLGVAFAGIAALTAQLSSTASGSNGSSGMAFGAAFAVNALANALGPTNPGSLGFQSSSLAWFSPVGWTQRFYPFDEKNWWILALFAGLFAATALAALSLINRRDVGRGLLADRRGRAEAPRWMLSLPGLAWRLQRGTLISWIFPMVFMGAMLGASAESLGRTMGETEFFGGAFSDAIAEFPFLVIGIAAMAAALYATKALLRMRSEEDGGPLENLLSTPVKRSAFMASHVLCGFAGGIGLVLLFSLSQAAAMGGSAPVTDFITAAVQQGAGMLVLGGFVLAAYGVFPKAAGALSFAVVLVAIVVGPFFGTALNLPQGLKSISPFTYIAFMPSEVSGGSMIVLLSIALILAAVGFASFARRDLKP